MRGVGSCGSGASALLCTRWPAWPAVAALALSKCVSCSTSRMCLGSVTIVCGNNVFGPLRNITGLLGRGLGANVVEHPSTCAWLRFGQVRLVRQAENPGLLETAAPAGCAVPLVHRLHWIGRRRRGIALCVARGYFHPEEKSQSFLQTKEMSFVL